MVLTALRLWQLVREQDESEMENPLLDSGEPSKAESLIKAGLNLRSSEECGSFWEDFMQLLANKEGFSDLLGVSPSTVTTWHSKISDTLDKIKERKTPDKAMLPTGEDEEIVSNAGVGNLNIGVPR